MAAPERKDHHTVVINGITVYLNPLPTDYKDRLVWAFSNSGAIGANRAARGFAELDSLASELNVDRRDLRGYLRGILDTEMRIAESVVDDDLDRVNRMLFAPVDSSSPLQLQAGAEARDENDDYPVLTFKLGR